MMNSPIFSFCNYQGASCHFVTSDFFLLDWHETAMSWGFIRPMWNTVYLYRNGRKHSHRPRYIFMWMFVCIYHLQNTANLHSAMQQVFMISLPAFEFSIFCVW